jgi:hypothetical protein
MALFTFIVFRTGGLERAAERVFPGVGSASE